MECVLAERLLAVHIVLQFDDGAEDEEQTAAGRYEGVSLAQHGLRHRVQRHHQHS